MVLLGLYYLGCDSFMYPQCHLKNPKFLVCAVTQSLIRLRHDERTGGLLAPCQSWVLSYDIVELWK